MKERSFASSLYLILISLFTFNVGIIFLIGNDGYLYSQSLIDDTTGFRSRVRGETKTEVLPMKKKKKEKIIWSELNEEERLKGLEGVKPYIKKQANLVNNRHNFGKGRWKLPSFDWSCDTKSVGSGWGGHHLCTDLLGKGPTCSFFSFGIARAYSFDKGLADNFLCHGFASDPTVNHPSNLHTNVTFHKIGANLLRSNMEFKKGEEVWWITSVPSLSTLIYLSLVYK